jgi:hypothetical protein
MRKYFKDNKTTAIQFANDILADINSGEVEGIMLDDASKKLYDKLDDPSYSKKISKMVSDMLTNAYGFEVVADICSTEDNLIQTEWVVQD